MEERGDRTTSTVPPTLPAMPDKADVQSHARPPVLLVYAYVMLIAYGIASVAVLVALVKAPAAWLGLFLLCDLAKVVLVIALLAGATWARRALLWTIIGVFALNGILGAVHVLSIIHATSRFLAAEEAMAFLAVSAIVPLVSTIVLALPSVIAACDGPQLVVGDTDDR